MKMEEIEAFAAAFLAIVWSDPNGPKVTQIIVMAETPSIIPGSVQGKDGFMGYARTVDVQSMIEDAKKRAEESSEGDDEPDYERFVGLGLGSPAFCEAVAGLLGRGIAWRATLKQKLREAVPGEVAWSDNGECCKGNFSQLHKAVSF